MIEYSLLELKTVNKNQIKDQYHKELIQWAIEEIERLQLSLTELAQYTQKNK